MGQNSIGKVVKTVREDESEMSKVEGSKKCDVGTVSVSLTQGEKNCNCKNAQIDRSDVGMIINQIIASQSNQSKTTIKIQIEIEKN